MTTSEKTLIKMYTSKILSSQIEYLDTQLMGIELGDSDEFVHHTRVISRRMRNTLEVFSDYFGKKSQRKWQNALKILTKSLTKIRDLDVQILFLENEINNNVNQKQVQGISRLLLRKKQKRNAYNKDVLSHIEFFNKTESIPEIKNFISSNQYQSEIFTPSAGLSEIAINKVEYHLKNCFSFVPFITNPENVKQLHSLRIAIKNLRYTVELFQDLYPSLDEYLIVLKSFQDELGKIHDCDIWLSDLDSFRKKELKRINQFYGQTGPFNFIKPGVDYLSEKILETRQNTFDSFLLHWNEHFQKQYWSRLRQQLIIFPPLEIKDEIHSDQLEPN